MVGLTKGRELSFGDGWFVTWGGLALALAAFFGFWFFWFSVVGGFLRFSSRWEGSLQKGVVYPVTVFGLIMYIYPHAISLLFPFSLMIDSGREVI